MKIVLLDEAQRRFEVEERWWREHRDAEELFLDEFRDTLRQLSAAPGVGQNYRRARGKLIQRLLMKKTRCHLYYSRPRPQSHRDSFALGSTPKTRTRLVRYRDIAVLAASSGPRN